ncbi:MAG: hypothetical protein PF690_11810 [Deltaproteobacteria bacterium]|jgi:diadenosine tetraphosphate (Ap4A) HIT family hydrolase|nr:hypothetical protein [Deltaproteobacteria bacterium]
MSCPFCNRESMMTSAPFDGVKQPCNRWIYKSDHCYVVLKPEQHTIGESIVILNDHKADLTDDIPIEKLSDFMNIIKIISTRTKNIAKNEDSESPERIYVGILCDGITTQHLHAHLIPRYPFSKYDESKYEEFFLKRDGEIEIIKKQKAKDLGGYWYVCDKEQNHYKSSYAQKAVKDRVRFLECLANELRLAP